MSNNANILTTAEHLDNTFVKVEPLVMLPSQYNIIYADPAWKYNKRANSKTKFGLGVYGHYPTLDYETMKQIQVEKLADKNCALFMWTTFPYLDKQIEVMKSWGFRYCTVAFVWVKTNKRQDLSQTSFLPTNLDTFFGIGYYTKSNTEICLLGMKGQLKVKSNNVSSIVIAPREEHSKKPAIVRDKIVELFGDLPRIELFARQKTDGWAVWGNEVKNDVNLLARTT